MKYIFIFALAAVSCTEKKSVPTQTANTTTAALIPELSVKIRTLNPSDLRIGPSYSTPVISAAQKFVIPIPALGKTGEPLLYPEKTHKAGQPILDYQGKPVGERGIVFFNDKDKSWQATAGDGKGVIIINEVSQLQADRLYQKISQFQLNPNELTLLQFKEVITYAQKELGLKDMYNSTRSFIEDKMTAVGSGSSKPFISDNVYGLKKRDDRDINQAIYIPGAFLFKGPAASAQKFTHGGVIIEQGGTMRGVQPEIFMRTYTLADGRAIQSLDHDIKTQLR